MEIVKAVLKADQKIHAIIRETPLEYSFHLSNMSGCNVYLKLENLQFTGSFKTRGAISKLMSLTPEERAKGIVAASTGNHGAAVAFGLRELGITGTIFVPKNASRAKMQAIEKYGTELRTYGFSGLETEIYAREYAETHNHIYISSYNDTNVIGGQGTVGLEIARQIDHLDAVFVSVGGGGLIAGISAYLKSVFDNLTVVGCSALNSSVMYESIKAGKIVKMPEKKTISDGTTGGIEQNAITFDLCRELIDEHCVISEDDIRKAMIGFMENHHLMIEGAAGVALASFLQMQERFKDKTVVIVVCGANIGMETLVPILAKGGS